MKITYIAPSTIPSETANSVQVMKVCQAMSRLRHEVELIVPGKPYKDHQALKSHYGIITDFNISWLPFKPTLRKIDFAVDALRLAAQWHSDLVYTRMLWVALIACWRKLPVILEMHDIPSGLLGPMLYRRYLRSKNQKLTVFITQALKNIIEQDLNVQHTEKEAFIAPDGVDLERYQALPTAAEARKALGLQEQFTAVYSGGFYPGRGLEILLDLAAAFPEVQFLCVGGKPEVIREWQVKADAMHLDNFTLTGFIANEKLPLYQATADVLLMPYRKQVAGSGGGDIAAVTSPMKVFEYMACGRAILCSNLPVLHEVLNEKNAAFYPPEDLPALKAALALLQKDQKLREALGRQARADVVQYSWDERMKAILAFFNQQ
jgi:glycosyltransferase involved in cell wall biosynthesis